MNVLLNRNLGIRGPCNVLFNINMGTRGPRNVLFNFKHYFSGSTHCVIPQILGIRVSHNVLFNRIWP